MISGDKSSQSRIIDECQHKSALLFVLVREMWLFAEFAPNPIPGDLNPRITDRKWKKFDLLLSLHFDRLYYGLTTDVTIK